MIIEQKGTDNMNYTEQAKTFKAGIGQLPSGNDDSVARVVVPLVKG